MADLTPASIPGFFSTDEDASDGITANRYYARDALTLANGGPRILVGVVIASGIVSVYPTATPDGTPTSFTAMRIFQAMPADLGGVVMAAHASAFGY